MLLVLDLRRFCYSGRHKRQCAVLFYCRSSSIPAPSTPVDYRRARRSTNQVSAIDRAPHCLLNEPWRGGKKLLLLEPRRLVIRAIASHMASLLGGPVGKTVPYRLRFKQPSLTPLA